MATTAVKSDCPECAGSATRNGHDTVCSNCGLVLEGSPIDRGPDWGRPDERSDKDPERAKPGNHNLPDRGLGSDMGRPADPDLRRASMYHRQAKHGSSKDRNRGEATTEIQRIASQLDVADSLAKQAKRMFRELHAADLVQGRDLDTLAATCLFTILRIHRRGLTAADVAAVAHCSERMIHRRHRWLADELELQVPPPSLPRRVRAVATDLDLDRETTDRAAELAAEIEDLPEVNGSPSAIAAGVIYHTTGGKRARPTQREIADAAGVSTTGLRKRWLDVREAAGPQLTITDFEGRT